MLGVPKPFRSFPPEMAARLMTLNHAADRCGSSHLMKTSGIGKYSASQTSIIRQIQNYLFKIFPRAKKYHYFCPPAVLTIEGIFYGLHGHVVTLGIFFLCAKKYHYFRPPAGLTIEGIFQMNPRRQTNVRREPNC